MLTLKCLILRYGNSLCPTPTPHLRPAVLRTKSLAASALASAPCVSGRSPPASNKEAVSLKTLSELPALGLQVVLLATQAFGGKFES